MATLKSQVQTLTGLTISSSGTTPDETELVVFLNDGLRETVQKILQVNPDKATLFAKTTILTNVSPQLVVDSGMIIDVTREDGTVNQLEPATQVPAGMRYRVTDLDSLSYRSKFNPCWYVESGLLNVRPEPSSSGNRAYVIHVAYDTIVIADSPSDLVQFPEQWIHLIPLYAGYKVLFTKASVMLDSLPNDIQEISLDEYSSTLPAFVKPQEFQLPDLLEDADINLSEVDDLSDFEVPSLNVVHPEFIAPDITLNFADADTWINVEEDSEMSAARIQVIGAQLQKHSSDIQIAVSKYSEGLDEFKNNVQVYSSKLQTEQARVGHELGVFQQQMSKALEKYKSKTGYDIQKFQNTIQAKIEEYKNGLTHNVTDFDASLKIFQADIQAINSKNQVILSKYTNDVQNYASKIQRIKLEYDAVLQRAAGLKNEYDVFIMGLAAPKAVQQQQQQQQQPRG
jgi:hypothetical protein